ncbi:MAG: 6-phosphofructokinase [Bacteroidetes bacterium SW_11_45_7]|nr:MAG: 6-phosphofructokinase [Bacteroidetes bacterium SW_11_45_7]
MENVGLLTSGGDAPGMNACLRAVVRAAYQYGIRIYGIKRGFAGLIDGEIGELSPEKVSNIVHKGGTFLKSARRDEFRTYEGMKKAYDQIQSAGIEGMIVIGGDGTFAGAKDFQSYFDIPFVGIPGTIDNDLYGTDFTIGYDTALNTVVEAIDKIRDTATSHDRLFFVEVMGRDAGLIALRSGLASGAEAILIPESASDIDKLHQQLKEGWGRTKQSHIVVVAEGDESGGAFQIADDVRENYPHLDTKVTVLGHVQRGGRPTAMDRVLASRLGVGAVNAIGEGQQGIMVGVQKREIVYSPFEKASKHHQTVEGNLMKLVDILAQ